MNVEYKCSGTLDKEELKENPEGIFRSDCGNRVMALPGGTKLKCRKHPEAVFVQVESAAGNFLYTEEWNVLPGQGKRASEITGTGVKNDFNAKPAANKQEHVQRIVASGTQDANPDGTIVWDASNLPEDMPSLRKVYEAVFGHPVDKRFGEVKVTNLIKVELERQAEFEAAQEEAQKAALAVETTEVDENGEEVEEQEEEVDAEEEKDSDE